MFSDLLYLQFISVCSTSTNWASVGSRRSSGGALANIGPAGSRPRFNQVKHLVNMIYWTRCYNWFNVICFFQISPVILPTRPPSIVPMNPATCAPRLTPIRWMESSDAPSF